MEVFLRDKVFNIMSEDDLVFSKFNKNIISQIIQTACS
jgi:hypothetical protein